MVTNSSKSSLLRISSIVLLCGFLLVCRGFAQTTTSPATIPNAKKDLAERERIVRSNAISTLDSVIDELPRLDDLNDQLLIAEVIVEQLGKSKRDRCRKMLDSLFDHAKEARRKTSRENHLADAHPDALVERIVELAASFDPKLAESYAERYSLEDTDVASDQRSGPDAARNAALRLRMALQLVDKAPAASVSVAEGSLNAGVFPETLIFLSVLRRKDVKLASRFFYDALGSIRRRGGLDVNELFLLYSYVFSPQRVPVATTRGIGLLSIPEYSAAAQEYAVEPVLAQRYLIAATETILDQNRLTPHAVESLRNGIEGDYYFVSVIQPLVPIYLSSLADAVAARRSVLLAMLQQDRRDVSGDAVDRWNKIPTSVSLTSASNGDTVDYLIERAEKTADPTRRDRLYYQAATTAVIAKEYDRAIKIVDKVSGPASEEAKQFIIYDVALHAARNNEPDLAEFYARRDADLTRRAFVFTTIATSLAERKPPETVRATGFLREAAELAMKLDKEEERAAVFFGVASIYSHFDFAAAPQMLAMGIESANKLEKFGRESRIRRGFKIGGFLFDYSLYGDEFTYAAVIRIMARRDFDGILQQVATFKSRLPRLRGTVIACDAVLVKASKR